MISYPWPVHQAYYAGRRCVCVYVYVFLCVVPWPAFVALPGAGCFQYLQGRNY